MDSTTFKAIFEALAVADLAAVATRVGEPQVRPPWQMLLSDVAQGASSSPAMAAHDYSDRFQQVSRASQAGFLLATLPVLMLNLDPYGHRLPYIYQWGATLGLNQEAVSHLGEWFLYLCRARQISGVHRTPSSSAWGQRWSQNLPPLSLLATPQKLVWQAQGQLWLSLKLAQNQGWNRAELGLVALMAVLSGGGYGLPLSLRVLQAADGKNQEQTASFWENLLQLSQELYAQWCGCGGRDHLNQGRSGHFVAVTP